MPLQRGTTTHLRIIYCEEAIAMNHIILSLWIKYIHTLCLQGKCGRDVLTIQLLTGPHLLFSFHFSCSQSAPAQIITSQGSKSFLPPFYSFFFLCLPVTESIWPWLMGFLEQRVQLLVLVDGCFGVWLKQNHRNSQVRWDFWRSPLPSLLKAELTCLPPTL